MRNYRIQQTLTVKGNGDKKYSYRIQHRFLWTWWYTRIYVSYYDNYIGNAIMKRLFTYNSLEEAKIVLRRLKESKNFTYKGNTIVVVFRDHAPCENMIHINYSNCTTFSGTNFYEVAPSFEELKNRIDKKITERTVKTYIQ